MPMKKNDLIKMGFVVNPHGIRGEAELRLFNPEDSILEDGMTVMIYPSSAKSRISPEGEVWKISKIRFGNKVICQFEGIRDRTHLETLIPFEVFLDREFFPEADEDEVYLVDLIDMDVVNEEGKVIGKLESFSDNGMQYLFDVRVGPTGEKITLPYVDAFFPKIDMEKRQITMVMPHYTE
jgi:16S rRNA processing protein RimM